MRRRSQEDACPKPSSPMFSLSFSQSHLCISLISSFHMSLFCAAIFSLSRSCSVWSCAGISSWGREDVCSDFWMDFLYSFRSWLSVIGRDVGVLPTNLAPSLKYSFIAVWAGIDSSLLSMCPNNFQRCCLTRTLSGVTLHLSYRSWLLIFSGQWTPITILRCLLWVESRHSRLLFVRPHVPLLYVSIGVTRASYICTLLCS